MADLNLDLKYFTHRKTKRLVGLLGRGADVLPIRLWCYCGEHHAEDGRLTGYSVQEIESLAGWWGKEGAFVNALLSVVFLEQDQQGFLCHDWLEHQGHIVVFKEKGRAMAMERWRKMRERAHAGSIATSIAADTPQHCHSGANGANQRGSAREAAVVAERDRTVVGASLPPVEKITADRELKRLDERLKALLGDNAFRDLMPDAQKEVRRLKERREVLMKMLGVSI